MKCRHSRGIWRPSSAAISLAVAEVLRECLNNRRAAQAIAAAGVAAVDLAWRSGHAPGSKLRPLLDAYFTALGTVATVKLA